MSFSYNSNNNYYQSNKPSNNSMFKDVLSMYGSIHNLNRAVYSRINESKTSNYYCPSDSKSANSYGSCVSRAHYGIQPGINSIIR